MLGSPDSFFNGAFIGLAGLNIAWKLLGATQSLTSQKRPDSGDEEKPAGVKSLQMRFLFVFWMMRMADWLQGPYFYEVYSSKIINSIALPLSMVSKLFLMGFATTGLFGPFLGRIIDTNGRKLGTLAFAALYTWGALSTRSNILPLLFLGRIAGGLGTSLLFSAPEAWLVGEHSREGFDGKWLGQTFGWAYAGDSLVAITAGQLASFSAEKSGPTGPFTLSVVFLLIGSLAAALTWKENVASQSFVTGSTEQSNKRATIGDAFAVMMADKRILLTGATQALFEGAMYIFVMQWAPALKGTIQTATNWGVSSSIPFGKVFSCFMACCLLGSTAFGYFQKRLVPSASTESSLKKEKKFGVEEVTALMLFVATVAMASATVLGPQSLAALVTSFFVFEGCVGMYFPSIGSLRSKYVPDSHRSVIMNLFGIPLNLIVVSVFLSIGFLGVQGALICGTSALGLATICMLALAAIK